MQNFCRVTVCRVGVLRLGLSSLLLPQTLPLKSNLLKCTMNDSNPEATSSECLRCQHSLIMSDFISGTSPIHRGNVASDSKNDPAKEAASFNAQVIINATPPCSWLAHTWLSGVHICEHLSTSWTHIDKFSSEGAGPAASRQVEQYLGNKCVAMRIFYFWACAN